MNSGTRATHPRWYKSTQDEAWPQRVAPADGEAKKLNAHCISALQGKLLTPDKEEDGHTRDHLFVFHFHLLPFHLYTPM
jgi:hypothetical protein